MKRLIALLALAPSVAAAQTDRPPPDPNAPPGFEFRVGGILVSGQRHNTFGTSTGNERTGSLKGFDGLLRGTGAGLQVRYLEGSFLGRTDSIISADVNLLLLPRQFSLVAGVSRRGLVNGLKVERLDFGRVGFSSSGWIGGSGLKTQVGGAYYLAFGDPKAVAGSTAAATTLEYGLEGEGSIIWSPPGVPIFVQLGYRAEVLNMKTGTTTHSELVRGIRLGGGLQFGGK
jgi:hypothetical protein